MTGVCGLPQTTEGVAGAACIFCAKTLSASDYAEAGCGMLRTADTYATISNDRLRHTTARSLKYWNYRKKSMR